jgi:hypothetical protein
MKFFQELLQNSLQTVVIELVTIILMIEASISWSIIITHLRTHLIILRKIFLSHFSNIHPDSSVRAEILNT